MSPIPLLAASLITKSYAGVRALSNVSFDLHEGEVHALVGENGAGKSTLIKVMTGAVAADSGTLSVAGAPVAQMSPAASRALGIAAIYQQPALFPHLTVAENIAFALEPRARWRQIDWRRRHRDARDLLTRVGADIDADRLVETLSMPEQQLVEIAKAIGSNARVLIMDEPTASLSEREVQRLFEVVARLKSERVGIIYISHRLEEILAIADRVTVLRDGSTVGTHARDGLHGSTLINLMIGRELSAIFPKRPVALGSVALELRNLTCKAAGVRDASLAVRSGEIVGLAGLVGSGRTELAQAVFGLMPADSGDVLVHGQPIAARSPAAAIDAGIALPSRRPQAARRRAGDGGGRKHQPRESAGCRRARVDRSRPRAQSGGALRRAAQNQDRLGRVGRRVPLGRQSAESRARALAGHLAQGSHPR